MTCVICGKEFEEHEETTVIGEGKSRTAAGSRLHPLQSLLQGKYEKSAQAAKIDILKLCASYANRRKDGLKGLLKKVMSLDYLIDFCKTMQNKECPLMVK